MPWAWIAIRLTVLGSSIEPSRSITRARGRPEARPDERFGHDQFVGFRAAIVARIDDEFIFALAVDGGDAAAAARAGVIDAQHAMHAGAQPLDDARFVAVFGFGQARQNAFARARARGRLSSRPGTTMIFGGGSFALPALRARQQLAVIVLAGDFQNGDRAAARPAWR